MIEYGFYKEVDTNLKETIDNLKNIAKEHNFGILTRIDVNEKFKEKLNIDFKQYVTFGLCNPKNAHKTIKMEENIGLLLPCNAIVYKKNNKTAVSIIKPTKILDITKNKKLKKIAENIEINLRNIINSL